MVLGKERGRESLEEWREGISGPNAYFKNLFSTTTTTKHYIYVFFVIVVVCFCMSVHTCIQEHSQI